MGLTVVFNDECFMLLNTKGTLRTSFNLVRSNLPNGRSAYPSKAGEKAFSEVIFGDPSTYYIPMEYFLPSR